MAQPRKLTCLSTGKIGKAERASREAQESKLKVSRADLTAPPDFLSESAQAEFMRVVRESEAIGIIDNLDLTVLALYANAWDEYIRCTEYIREHGPTVVQATANGDKEVISPWVNAQEKYAKQIFTCSSKLGLAVTDRLKLVVPAAEEAPENKFLKYAK